MYPVVRIVKDKESGKPILLAVEESKKQYIELLTIFPDDSDITTQFLKFLDSEESSFDKLWPVNKSDESKNP